MVAGVRNVFYLRFFSAIWSVSLIINKPIEHILQGLILGHNAHNSARYVTVSAQHHSILGGAYSNPAIKPANAYLLWVVSRIFCYPLRWFHTAAPWLLFLG